MGAQKSKLQKVSFAELMKGVCTSVPGHILAFDPKTQLAQVQIGIVRVDKGEIEVNHPPIIESPVCFVGGNHCLEYEILPGCEGDIFFSQRCVDGWLQTGGVASNPIGRFHDMQDAFFLPGFRSLPNVLPDFQNNGIRLRNKDGTQFAWLKRDGSIFVENGAGHIRLGADGIVTINGVTFGTDSLVSTPNDMKAGNITLKTHRTSGVTRGNQISDGPVV